MALEHMERFFERNRRALVGLMIEGDADQPFFLASGVAIRLGGRKFILTAAHNVWSDGRLAKIAIGTPTVGIVTLIAPGNGSAGRIHLPPAQGAADPEPDVAVIEPTEKTVMPPEPFEADDVQFFDTSQTTDFSNDQVAGCELVVTGFPVRMASFTARGQTRAPQVTSGALTVNMSSVRVWSIPSIAGERLRFPKEPDGGRGVHAYLSLDVVMPDGGSIAAVDPVGMSGGPLIVPEGNGVLVGLMRSKVDFHNGWDIWFEPAAEAVRLLVAHEDPGVAAAAQRVVARYDDARRIRGPGG